MKKSNLAEKLHNFSENDNEDAIAFRVYSTMDYTKFKFIECNRPINKPNLKRLIEAMTCIDFKAPIIVTEDYYIIDGQHRYEARKELLLPVYYYFVDAEANADSIVNATMAQKPLTLHSISELRAKSGNEDYQKLLDFMEMYGLNLGVSISLTYKKYKLIRGGDKGHQFKLGEYKCDNLQYAEDFADYLNDLEKETKTAIVKNTYFVHSLIAVDEMQGFDKDHFLEQVRKYKHLLEQKATKRQYQDLIHEIYNYNTRKEKKLNLRPI